MKRAVVITGHFPQQKRKASMQWTVEHLQKMGWHVTMVTIGYSWLSRLKRDARLRALDTTPARGLHRHSDTLTSLYDLPLLHPFCTKYPTLNNILEPISALFTRFWERMLHAPVTSADLVIVESGPPVLLAPFIARIAPQAARIYRVNDDIRLLNTPASLLCAETAHMHHFTRISTASPHLAQRFSAHSNVTLDCMGVPQDTLNVSTTDPYARKPAQKIAICAGTTLLDIPAITRIAHARPNWQIHVLGRLKSSPPHLPNVTWHGEQPFETTLPYIAHADIGLAPYRDTDGIQYQTTNSNRILLYRFYGLPTLGPDRLCDDAIPSIIGYSAPDALARCETWIKSPEAIPDWSELAHRLAQNGVTEPASEVSTSPATIRNPRVKTVPEFASNA